MRYRSLSEKLSDSGRKRASALNVWAVVIAIFTPIVDTYRAATATGEQ
jgi:hypothetical protein